MKRVPHSARSDWRGKVEALGFDFHTMQEQAYWIEDVHYEFTLKQIDQIEEVANELYKLSLQAVDHVITNNRFAEFAIPPAFIDYIKQSWQNQDPDIYGRFDLIYDGKHPPKMLEYNADTPTSLFEAAVVQWHWLQDVFPKADQFNLIHEKLVTRWKAIKNKLYPEPLYFACIQDAPEDFATCEYMRDTCVQAGLATAALNIPDIGWNDECFTDLNEQEIAQMFKLYPWEWLCAEEFGAFLPKSRIKVIEPPWKMLLANKALLPLLWELNPNHPNLLPAYFDASRFKQAYVQKPIYGREGANVTLHLGNETISNPGDYGSEGYIYQEYYPLPEFDGYYPVLGAWTVGDEAAGLGIREDKNRITHNLSRFVPHMFIP